MSDKISPSYGTNDKFNPTPTICQGTNHSSTHVLKHLTDNNRKALTPTYEKSVRLIRLSVAKWIYFVNSYSGTLSVCEIAIETKGKKEYKLCIVLIYFVFHVSISIFR